MAKEYGTAIRPYLGDSDKIDEMANHLNWSKSELVMHMVAKVYDDVMSAPKAIRPGDS